MSLRDVLAPITLFAVAVAVGAALLWQGERLWAAGQRDAAAQAAAGAELALEQQVSRALSATYALAALIHHDPDMESFDRVAAEILPLYGAVSSNPARPGRGDPPDSTRSPATRRRSATTS